MPIGGGALSMSQLEDLGVRRVSVWIGLGARRLGAFIRAHAAF